MNVADLFSMLVSGLVLAAWVIGALRSRREDRERARLSHAFLSEEQLAA